MKRIIDVLLANHGGIQQAVAADWYERQQVAVFERFQARPTYCAEVLYPWSIFSRTIAEQATQRENDDVLHALNEDAKHIVSQINSALHRMETGDYGICTKCGAEISEGRLEIVPYAALCIKCAEKSD